MSRRLLLLHKKQSHTSPTSEDLTLLLDLQADALLLSDGDPVATWGSFTAAGSTRPTKQTVGGYPAVVFDGVDDFMALGAPESAALDNLASFTLLAVLTVTTADPGNTYAPIICKIQDDTFAGWALTHQALVVFVQADGASDYIANSGSGLTVDTRYVITSELVSLSELHYYKNGANDEQYPGGDSAGALTTYTNAEPVRLGVEGDGGAMDGFYPGKLHAVVIYAPALDATTRQAKEAELATRYGVILPESPTLLLDLQADALVLSDGDPVSTWADASGNGHNFTQTGSARPTYHAGAGYPYLEFDGIDDWMLGSDFADNQASMTIFIVTSALTDNGPIVTKLDVNADWLYSGWAVQHAFFNDPVRGATLQVFDGAAMGNPLSGTFADGFAFDTSSKSVLTFEHLAMLDDHYYANGVLRADEEPDVTGTQYATTEVVRLGVEGGVNGVDDSGYHAMRLYAVVIYAPALDATARAAKEVELAIRYGITL